MPVSSSSASALLLAAHSALKEKQAARRAERIALGLPVYTDSDGRRQMMMPSPKSGRFDIPTPSTTAPATPPIVEPVAATPHFTPAPPPVTKPVNQTIPLYPSLAVTFLQEGIVPAARAWHLFRYLDQTGKGWLPISALYQAVTSKDAPLRICGRRQLRNILKQGDGLFWHRDATRLWLRSPVKVAATLGLERLAGRPVALPLTILCSKIGTVRAHFYASFHSGRKTANPISRQTLADLTGVSRRSQQQYEQEAGVRAQRNIAVGPAIKKKDPSNKDLQEYSWQHGHALFQFHDKKGRHGRAGQTYLAWQLPNSYAGPHKPLSKGRQNSINRALKDLSTKGMTGNKQSNPVIKLYCPNGRSALARHAQSTADAVYWPGSGSLNNSRRPNHFIQRNAPNWWHALSQTTGRK